METRLGVTPQREVEWRGEPWGCGAVHIRGYDGPFPGTRHQFAILGQKRVAIFSNAEHSVPQLRRLISAVDRIMDCAITLKRGTV
jgi:hypothetical protein